MRPRFLGLLCDRTCYDIEAFEIPDQEFDHDPGKCFLQKIPCGAESRDVTLQLLGEPVKAFDPPYAPQST